VATWALSRVIEWVKVLAAGGGPVATLALAGWLALLLVCLAGLGFYVYKAERDRGNVAHPVAMYEAVIRRWEARDEKPGGPSREGA